MMERVNCAEFSIRRIERDVNVLAYTVYLERPCADGVFPLRAGQSVRFDDWIGLWVIWKVGEGWVQFCEEDIYEGTQEQRTVLDYGPETMTRLSF